MTPLEHIACICGMGLVILGVMTDDLASIALGAFGFLYGIDHALRRSRR